MDLDEAKARVQEEVDRRADLLLEVSHRIHGHPELMFEERFAADLLASALGTEAGMYALDAMVLGYNAVAALRQHIAPTDRIHGVFTRAGDKPNIVPDHTVAEWYVRSATIDSLQALKPRVLACLEGGAAAAGCRIEVHPTCPEYTDLRTNPALIELYSANSAALGRRVVVPDGDTRVVASTDMGNVSHLVPSIHPM